MGNQSVRQIVQHLEKVGNILIVVGGSPSVDSMGSALALFLGLSERGKRVQVVTQNPIRVEHSRLVGCDKVETNLGSSKSFVISLPQAVDSIEKVSCYAEGKTLNIVLQPYADVNEFDPADIQYSKASGSFDTLILVDVASKQEAQKHLAANANLLNELPVVALGRVGDPTIQMRYVYTHHSATAQGILELFAELGFTLSADAANNLLQGIYEASDDFHAPNITPQIFEDASKLLKVIHGELGRTQPAVSAASNRNMPMTRPAMPMPSLPNMPAMPKPGAYGQNMNRPMPQPNSFPRPQTQPNFGGALPPLPNFPRPNTQPNYGQPAPNVPNFNQPNSPFPAPNGRPNVPSQNFGPNKIGTNQEWEVDPFFEFDKAPDQDYGQETMGGFNPAMSPESGIKRPNQAQQNQPKMPGREAFQSQTSPRSGGGNQGGRRNNPNRQGQNRPNPGNQPKGQNQQPPFAKATAGQANQPEDDWLAPKIYKTEDLL